MLFFVFCYFVDSVFVFPLQCCLFYEYEVFKFIYVISSSIAAGKIKVFTVDSLDNQTWANWSSHPADRARRHQDYDRYITDEVVTFIRMHSGNTDQKFITTGCSMGAYHAANFFFRHPDIFDTVIAISGLFQLRMFVGDYVDETVYFNTPLYFLPNLTDPWYLEQYRQSNIIVCVGQGAWEEPMLEDAFALKRILDEKGIPAWIDVWGHDVNHDWPWWRKMTPYFLEKLGL